MDNISAVLLEDKSLVTATTQSITCSLSGLSASADIVWIDPQNANIPISGADYSVNTGSVSSGNQESVLVIQPSILQSMVGNTTYKCQAKSTLYPDNSPNVIKEVVLTTLIFGKLFLLTQ